MKLPRKIYITLVAIILLGSIIAAGVIITVPEVKWRAEVAVLKLKGDLTDLEWNELVHMLKPGSGYYLKPILETKNPYNAIRNPYTADVDIEAGKRIFGTRCAMCHGADGSGFSGPSLIDNESLHGDSDWSLYRTITRGVSGTAMPAHDFTELETWQIISFIRILATRQADVAATNTADTDKKKPPLVSYSRLRNARKEPHNWLSYQGTYDGQRHSPLSLINSKNVHQLRLEWVHQMNPAEVFIETTPVVVDGVMYATEPPNNVLALNAGTGELLWSYSRKLPEELSLCCGFINRGVAILGDKVYLGTLDAHLVALDAASGKVVWDIKVADRKTGYSITSAPLAIDGKIIVGMSGGEFGTRGFLDAYDAETGKRLWRFHTIPGPGDAGHDSWSGDSWKTGGGPTWVIGSYDPALNLLYWGVGNPAPDFLGDVRKGDNLYTCSVVALDADTGALKWHFQFTPHDTHDWDANQIPVLVDAKYDGKMRKLLLTANKNGFYYVLDRETGEYLNARAFAKQTWANGIDSTGRPLIRPESEPTEKGTLIYPSTTGATNWWPPAYNPSTGLFYVSVVEKGLIYFKHFETYEPGEMYYGGGRQNIIDSDIYTAVRALEYRTGKLKWEYRLPRRTKMAHIGGLLSTEGNLIFFGDAHKFFALDSKTGAELWRVNLGGIVHAAPSTYMIGNKQYITIVAGKSLFTFSLGK